MLTGLQIFGLPILINIIFGRFI